MHKLVLMGRTDCNRVRSDGKGQVVVAELFRCPVGETGVWPDTIIIVTPRRQQRPRFVERREQRLA
jgi:hypothetical protein